MKKTAVRSTWLAAVVALFLSVAVSANPLEPAYSAGHSGGNGTSVREAFKGYFHYLHSIAERSLNGSVATADGISAGRELIIRIEALVQWEQGAANKIALLDVEGNFVTSVAATDENLTIYREEIAKIVTDAKDSKSAFAKKHFVNVFESVSIANDNAQVKKGRWILGEDSEGLVKAGRKAVEDHSNELVEHGQGVIDRHVKSLVQLGRRTANRIHEVGRHVKLRGRHVLEQLDPLNERWDIEDEYRNSVTGKSGSGSGNPPLKFTDSERKNRGSSGGTGGGSSDGGPKSPGGTPRPGGGIQGGPKQGSPKGGLPGGSGESLEPPPGEYPSGYPGVDLDPASQQPKRPGSGPSGSGSKPSNGSSPVPKPGSAGKPSGGGSPSGSTVPEGFGDESLAGGVPRPPGGAAPAVLNRVVGGASSAFNVLGVLLLARDIGRLEESVGVSSHRLALDHTYGDGFAAFLDERRVGTIGDMEDPLYYEAFNGAVDAWKVKKANEPGFWDSLVSSIFGPAHDGGSGKSELELSADLGSPGGRSDGSDDRVAVNDGDADVSVDGLGVNGELDSEEKVVDSDGGLTGNEEGAGYSGKGFDGSVSSASTLSSGDSQSGSSAPEGSSLGGSFSTRGSSSNVFSSRSDGTVGSSADAFSSESEGRATETGEADVVNDVDTDGDGVSDTSHGVSSGSRSDAAANYSDGNAESGECSSGGDGCGGVDNPFDDFGGDSCGGKGCRGFDDLGARGLREGSTSLAILVGEALSLVSGRHGVDVFELVVDWSSVGIRDGGFKDSVGLLGVFEGLFRGALGGSGSRAINTYRIGVLGLMDWVYDSGNGSIPSDASANGSQGAGVEFVANKADGDSYHGRMSDLPRGSGERVATGERRAFGGSRTTVAGAGTISHTTQATVKIPTAKIPQAQKLAALHVPTAVTEAGPVTQTPGTVTKLSSSINSTGQIQNPESQLANNE